MFARLIFAVSAIVVVTIGSALAQTSGRSVEGSTYETAKVQSPGIHGMIVGQGFYIFQSEGKVIFRMVSFVPAGSRMVNQYDLQTNSYRLTEVLDPPQALSKDLNGTYVQTGSRLLIVLPTKNIDAIISDKGLEGTEVTKPDGKKYLFAVLKSKTEIEKPAVNATGGGNGVNLADLQAYGEPMRSKNLNGIQFDLPPGLVRLASGLKVRPADGYTWVNHDDLKDFRVKKVDRK